MCVECDESQNMSTFVEVRYETLVEEFNEELCIVMFVQQEEEYFEVDDAKHKTNDEHELNAKEECFDEHDSE